MHIALIGPGGNVGSRILIELLNRGHDVTGICRSPDRVQPRPRLVLTKADATSESSLRGVIGGHDALISAARFLTMDPSAVIGAVKKAGVGRLLVVGGAASLEIAPGKILLDSPDFPAEYKPEASAGKAFLDLLRRETALDWTFLSPSNIFVPGPRTGKFRVGGDGLLAGPDGKSWISIEDYAIAMVDEIENPRHTRARFTVGY